MDNGSDTQASTRPARVRKLRVYGWHGFRSEAKGDYNSCQTREIMAAHSIAEVRRLTDCRGCEICETGNKEELAVATAEPLVVFWKNISEYSPGAYRRATPEPEPSTVPPEPSIL